MKRRSEEPENIYGGHGQGKLNVVRKEAEDSDFSETHYKLQISGYYKKAIFKR
jgi:hypothetical protein